ncbi:MULTISPECIES: SIR2 family NAD-dependent protein deacylase [Priestia]|uniref:SIR2 family NAD-dependent protein deacylase n=1 Tax=Priestia TaxID=2800373 RepID=UPI001E2D646D|nr:MULTISPECIES: SIR2 family protein [Priestia]MEB4884459.1 SIR2 family protein [Priestia megaterium]
MNKDPEKLFEENLVMYPHLKNIRDKLWANDKKSGVSLMVGAGFSLNAKKIEGSFEGMAVWNDLKNRLVQDLTHHFDIEYKDVLEIGQIYVKEYGRASLDEILKEAIPDENYEPDQLHYNLLQLPWSDVYTTNYDTLLERAKKLIYERNYEVIYDISDIPSSIQPRIIKLHGSFPAHRPFIFTSNDYNEYPEKFSPFVNMVQQSIMETTFVLIGFSGEDPNFNKWTTWVLENLGEHMPKIYMIGYGQKHRKSELEEKGITLIDFEELYKDCERPFYSMFADLFEFLSYRKREEKTKWPHMSYGSTNINDLKYNRETYPGWVVMPDEIRRKYANLIRVSLYDFISDIRELNNQVTDFINEVLWCYEKFSIPFDSHIHEKFQQIIDQQNQEKICEELFPLILRLLKEARLDCNIEDFNKYRGLLKELNLNKEQQHRFAYEQILYSLNFNDISAVEELMNEWLVSSKEIEWGIKKGSIFYRINEKSKAQKMFEEYLQTIRSLLAIKSNDFRLLSLESIALYHRNRIIGNDDYGYDRLRYLSSKHCNANKEFERTIISIKKYEKTFGTSKKREFDPGVESSLTSFGDPIKQEILDSFAVSEIQEAFNLFINNESRYNLALENLDINHPIYSQIKRIARATAKNIDKIYSREVVYKLSDYNLNILVTIAKNTFINETKSNVNIYTSLEVLSRIYFALPLEVQKELDILIIKFINERESFQMLDKNVLSKVIKRFIFAKGNEDSKVFCEQLISTKIISQKHKDKSIYKRSFFEPFIEIFSIKEKVHGMSISEETLLKLLKKLNKESDYSIKESALIRLTFLALGNSLPEKYYKDFISIIQLLPKDKDQGISDFVFSATFDKLINSKGLISKETKDEFINKDIPTFYQNGLISDNFTLLDYFNELKGILPDYIGIIEKEISNFTLYEEWLQKFYLWWDSQKEGVLINSRKTDSLIPDRDYIIPIITVLKNNIWGTIPENYLSEKDKFKAKQIYVEINKRRPDVSAYLVPCLDRLKVDLNYSLKDLLSDFFDGDTSKVEMLGNILYDYLVFMERGEVERDYTVIKTELFNMMKYGAGEVLKIATNVLYLVFKNIPSVINDNDCNFIINYVNNYLKKVKEDYFKTLTQEDFELISSLAKMIACVTKNKSTIVGERLNDWRDYISNHRLPEVNTNRDLFQSLL